MACRTLESFRDRLRVDPASARVLHDGRTLAGLSMIRNDELNQFYVARAFRGSGAAAVLMADAEAHFAARGVTTAWLACAIGNERAARFYEKSGWRRVRVIATEAPMPHGSLPLQVWRYEKVLSAAALPVPGARPDAG